VRRLATAIREASDEGTNSQMGACIDPLDEHSWCTGDVDGAALNEAWEAFEFWE
jgi:hypothetical protein